MLKFLKKKIPIWEALIIVILWTLLVVSFIYGEYLAVEKEKDMRIPEIKIPEELGRECDALNPCPEGEECYLFEGKTKAFCWLGDPCQRCESGECNIAESYPMQVFCE